MSSLLSHLLLRQCILLTELLDGFCTVCLTCNDSYPVADLRLDLTSLSGTAAGVTWTYVNETSRQDPEKRAYVSAMVRIFTESESLPDSSLQMNAFAYIFSAWVPIFTFPTYAQPYVETGLWVTVGFSTLAGLIALTIGYLDRNAVKVRLATQFVEKKQPDPESPSLDSKSDKSHEK